MNPRIVRNAAEEIKMAFADVLGDENCDIPDYDGDKSFSVYVNGEDLGIDKDPFYPGEEYEECADGTPPTDLISYEEWKALVGAKTKKYEAAAEKLRALLPGMSVEITFTSNGPEAPEAPAGWHNEYFLDVPNSFIISIPDDRPAHCSDLTD